MNFILLQKLADGAGFYAETNLNYIIVEPWNAISSLTFLIPVFYWLNKLRGRYRDFPFLTFCMPLLFMGGLGSTFFHAFRYSRILLLMDVLPILILTLSLSIYFWYKVLNDWKWVLLIVIVFFSLQLGLIYYTPNRQYAINIAYFIRGIFMFLPAALLLRNISIQQAYMLWLAIGCFILALFFRYFDKNAADLMYMGSHWLWHVSTAIGSFYLAEFLYIIANKDKRSFLEA